MIELIAFISTIMYFWNVLEECTNDNNLKKYYLGYAVISLLTIYTLDYSGLLIVMIVSVASFTLLVIISNISKQ